MFSSDFFKGNRARLRHSFPAVDLFVLAGNGLMQRSESSAYPFKQNNNIWYLCGVSEPNIILVIDGSDEYIILPGQDPSNILFEGQMDKAAIQKTSGVKNVMELSEIWPELKAKVARAKSIGILAPGKELSLSGEFYTNPANRRLTAKLKRLDPKGEFVAVDSRLAAMRSVKQPVELAAIEKAIDISARTFKRVRQNLPSFKSENQIERLLTTEFMNRGASGHAYPPIVAGGANACVLHYVKNNQPLKKGQLVLIDAGAEFENYASDITRTYSLGRPTRRQTDVFKAVLAIQAFAISKLKAGIAMRDYELAVLEFAAGQLQALGLIKTSNPAQARRYYPHSTSHFLGLDVHDAGDYYSPLQAGMVLTVEPGIYIPEENIGVRIEDNVLLGKTGCRNLSQGLPKSLI